MSAGERKRHPALAEYEPITLDLSPWEVFRALQALRESRGMIATAVADLLEAAAPTHMAVLAEIDTSVKRERAL